MARTKLTPQPRNRPTLCLTVDPRTAAALREKAAREGSTASEIADRALAALCGVDLSEGVTA